MSNYDNVTKIPTCVEQDTLLGNTKYFSHVWYVQRNTWGKSSICVASIEEFLHMLRNPMRKTISIEYIPARDVWVLRQGNRILDSFDTLAEAQQTYPFAEVYAHD